MVWVSGRLELTGLCVYTVYGVSLKKKKNMASMEAHFIHLCRLVFIAFIEIKEAISFWVEFVILFIDYINRNVGDFDDPIGS